MIAMRQKTQEDLALDRLLDQAASPPHPSADLAARIAARARLTPQMRKSAAAPYAAGMALAASLALGIWLGAVGIAIPGLNETASLQEISADDLPGLGEAQALSEGEVP
jgi:hypothetical protein